MILEVDPHFPQPGIVEHAVEIIKENHGIIVYPTDTVYGLGCDINDSIALQKINDLKKRSEIKQYSIMVEDLKRLKKYAEVNSKQEKILTEYLPGAFTFILKASERVSKALVATNGTIGIRIPRNRLCRALVKELNSPIITTSFNLSGQEVYTDVEKVPEKILNQIDVILDAGQLGTIGSTIIDLTGPEPIIIRKGKGIY